MNENEIREGDIVEIDYIEEFTKVHRNEGKAIVLWKDGFSHQPLVTKLTEYRPTWMIYDEFSKVVGHIEPREVLKQALTQEPCEDCISRQAVLDETYNWSRSEFLRVVMPFDFLRKRINSLPSVNPQEKTGHWIRHGTGYSIYYGCSLCGCVAHYTETADSYLWKLSNYCPDCGARMESEQNE